MKTIRLHVNSPGGDVFAAVNMANALRDQRFSKGRTVDVHVDGLAASAASVVIMAGNTIAMGDNALLMIHNPWSVALGNAAEMRKVADELDMIRDVIVTTYGWQSSLGAEAIAALMDAETWMDADEAIANGFATAKVEGLKAAALLGPRSLSRLQVPERFKARVEALREPAPAEPAPPTPAEAADVLRLCREADAMGLAEELVRAGATIEQAQARIAEHAASREQAATRAKDIRAACHLAHLDRLAESYVSSGLTLDGVKAQLVVLSSMADPTAIDGSLTPDHGAPKGQPRIDVQDVYAKRNRHTKE